ncbi:hypothetical protein FHU30_004502 [Actinomadura rupiterrae]|nr:hypothetical protein [Actinomadura rupiterrae]
MHLMCAACIREGLDPVGGWNGARVALTVLGGEALCRGHLPGLECQRPGIACPGDDPRPLDQP